MPTKNQPSDPSPPNRNRFRGQTVLVTRAAEQCEPLRLQLQQLGAKVIVHPTIEIKPPTDLSQLDTSLARLDNAGQLGWVVFVSGNGVTHFASRLSQLGISIEALNRHRIAAIGAATLARLKSLGIDNVCLPKTSNSESLAQLIVESAAGQRVLVIRADRGSDELGNRLRAAEIDFEEVVAYRSVDVETADPEVLEMLAEGKIDWVTMTSSAIASSTINLFSAALTRGAGQTKTVSISPRTSQTMRALGVEPDAEAIEFNMAGVVAAMQNSD